MAPGPQCGRNDHLNQIIITYIQPFDGSWFSTGYIADYPIGTDSYRCYYRMSKLTIIQRTGKVSSLCRPNTGWQYT